MIPEFELMRENAAKAEKRLLGEIEELQASLKGKQKDLATARGLLKQFGGSGAKSVKKTTPEIILQTAVDVLTENEPQAIPVEDLKSLCQERLKKEGYNLVGAFRHFEKLLQGSEKITAAGEGVYGLVETGVSKVA